MGICWFSHGGLRAAYWRFCLPNLFLLVEDGTLPNQSLLVEAGASTQSASSCRSWGLLNLPLFVEAGAYQSSLFTSKTGPSLQTQRLPSVVFSTQQRQAPTPQAIMFSSEASQRMPSSVATRPQPSSSGSGRRWRSGRSARAGVRYGW